MHAGDFVSADVLEELRELGPVEAVFGNMDDETLKHSLPRRRVVDVGDARIGVVHVPGPAAGRRERLAGWFPDCDAVVYGHTHAPEIARHEDVLILNPGSPTERRRAPEHTMIVLTVAAGGLQPRLLTIA